MSDYSRRLIIKFSLKKQLSSAELAASLANGGAWTNGMPMSMTLGCSSWRQQHHRQRDLGAPAQLHLGSLPDLASTQPSDEELFGKIMHED
jgi:sulfoacetaldehyde dehydrogenase